MSTPISVITPIAPAFERMKAILFRPFNLQKWIAIGFCAWLANLAGGGGGFNFNTGGGWPGSSQETTKQLSSHDIQQWIEKVRIAILAHLTLIELGVVAFFLIVIVVWVVLSWLRARGQFMFLNCVALNCTDVQVPWRKYGKEAHSLWLFLLALGGVALVLTLPFLGAGAMMALGWVKTGRTPGAGSILGLMGGGMLWGLVMLVVGVVPVLTKNFVVPIQYLRGVKCMEAWKIFHGILRAHAGSFILFVLFNIVLGMGAGMVVMIFVICTIFIGAILLAIPFVGTVLMLPILTFFRAYSLYFLAQFGPDFNVFPAIMPPPVPSMPPGAMPPPPPPPL